VVEAEVRTGILDIAAECQADLIVLGSHGRTGLSRFHAGQRSGVCGPPCSLFSAHRANPTPGVTEGRC
jgi:hypothetical protein